MGNNESKNCILWLFFGIGFPKSLMVLVFLITQQCVCLCACSSFLQSVSARSSGARLLQWRLRPIHHTVNQASAAQQLAVTVSHQQCCPSGTIYQLGLSSAAATFRLKPSAAHLGKYGFSGGMVQDILLDLAAAPVQ